MAFQVLSGVDIGFGFGNAFGGGIYSASCDIGFSRGPTKITLNIVSESGRYYSTFPNVYNAPYNINFNGHMFSGMYLYSYEKTKSADQSVMTANFIDSSLVLDKIYIGLLNRQGRQYVDTHILTGQFSVRCPQESQGYVTDFSGRAYRPVDYIPINNGCYFKKGEDGGGYIILGSEYFPSTNCEVPKVDYNFTELCNALTTFGIKHELSTFDLNTMYRQEYVGTLREVLNNWGADFAFEFFVENGVLKGIDLQKPININNIQTFAETNEYVNSSSYGESLENSFNQTLIARYLKAHEKLTYNNTFNYTYWGYLARKTAAQVFIPCYLSNFKAIGGGKFFVARQIELVGLFSPRGAHFRKQFAVFMSNTQNMVNIFDYRLNSSTIGIALLTKSQIFFVNRMRKTA